MYPTLQAPARTLDRDQFVKIVNAASQVHSWKFARQACMLWIAQYPGDLPVRLEYARSLIESGQLSGARISLHDICGIDPEYTEAVELLFNVEILLSARSKQKPEPLEVSAAWYSCLGGRPNQVVQKAVGVPLPGMLNEKKWLAPLRKARQALDAGDLDSAEAQIQSVVVSDDSIPLMASTHLMILYKRLEKGLTPIETLRSLAAYYHTRWPECAQAKLLLAQALMSAGEHDKAVSLLHDAAGQDITGQVPERLWGKSHPYQDLWSDYFQIPFDLPIPAAVNAALGWNMLPSIQQRPTHTWSGSHLDFEPLFQGSKHRESEEELRVFDIPEIEERERIERANGDLEAQAKALEEVEILETVRQELEKIGESIAKPEAAQSDARYPVYVLMTTRRGLERRYGPQISDVIEMEMTRLVDAVERRKDWGAMLFYADEGACIRDQASKLEGKTRSHTDPWALKLALKDLDDKLKENGERIGAVLIIGGPDIVPFHNLPNPVDDADDEVPSDNPYATSNENYFIPEWPVGRLPDGADMSAPNPEYLLDLLAEITESYHKPSEVAGQKAWYLSLWEWLVNWLFRHSVAKQPQQTSLGYCAAVWKGASTNVFRPIGGNDAVMLSPPIGTLPEGSKIREGSPLPASQLGYFNLHGLEDSKEWFGQSDPFAEVDASDGEDYPVAVSPEDILNSAQPPAIVFSEACYGGNILGKSTSDSLCLSFLQAGCMAFIGSTCTAYGSIDMPLIAADFLANRFWEHIRDGLTVGEAYQLAKVDLAAEMDERQGYLDGEDQKTLISFVLYGDPLAHPGEIAPSRKAPLRIANRGNDIPVVCDKAHKQTGGQVPEEVLGYVRNVVEQYLPGMSDADVIWSQEHWECDGDGCRRVPQQQNRNGKNGAKAEAQKPRPKRQVVTLCKQVTRVEHTHQHYARLTLDEGGKLVKLAVSR